MLSCYLEYVRIQMEEYRHRFSPNLKQFRSQLIENPTDSLILCSVPLSLQILFKDQMINLIKRVLCNKETVHVIHPLTTSQSITVHSAWGDLWRLLRNFCWSTMNASNNYRSNLIGQCDIITLRHVIIAIGFHIKFKVLVVIFKTL